MAVKRQPELARERRRFTATVVRLLDKPMVVLSAAWSALLVIELTRGLSTSLQRVSDAIWIAFAAQFAIEFLAAPGKRAYLRNHWLTAVSLALPAFRLLRLVRLVRVARAGAAVRGFSRRGIGYLSVLTLLVAVIGAAGMYRFEFDAVGGPGFSDYSTALWWTAMLLTTMGSDYWPATPEGRLLCLLLALYAFAVFGYVTASLAAFFIDSDKTARPMA